MTELRCLDLQTGDSCSRSELTTLRNGLQFQSRAQRDKSGHEATRLAFLSLAGIRVQAE